MKAASCSGRGSLSLSPFGRACFCDLCQCCLACTVYSFLLVPHPIPFHSISQTDREKGGHTRNNLLQLVDLMKLFAWAVSILPNLWKIKFVSYCYIPYSRDILACADSWGASYLTLTGGGGGGGSILAYGGG